MFFSQVSSLLSTFFPGSFQVSAPKFPWSQVEVSPNVVTYNSLLAARSNASWRWALALLSEMEEVKLQPETWKINRKTTSLVDWDLTINNGWLMDCIYVL
jgi:hypothetical protein